MLGDNGNWLSCSNQELVVLITKRMMLRPCTVDDRNDFMDLERDPEVMRYLNGGHPVDQEIGDPESPFAMPRGTEPEVWTARMQGSDKFVGWFGLWQDSPTVAELGYRLQRAVWGQGFATEGARALIDWGFKNYGSERILACAAANNVGSCRVLEKLGFQRIGAPNEENEVNFALVAKRRSIGSTR
jgi:RimJ/RimL family protein N-acetyltransferase